MTGKLISFDGLDSSGKATQTNRLCQRFAADGRQTLKFETPDYTTSSGQALKARLQGKLGDWRNTPWQEKMNYFAANRVEHKEEVLSVLKSGGIVIYDRYVPSSLVFMLVEAAGAAPREEIIAAVEQLEYTHNGMPKENVSIFLDVPPETTVHLLTERKAARREDDEYTDQLAVQTRMYDEYVKLAKEQPDRTVQIMCMDGQRLRTADEVEDLIWQAVTTRELV